MTLLSYRTSKQMRKSLYEDALAQTPIDCHEADRWNELSQEFGCPRGMSLGQAMAILAVITAEQGEEIREHAENGTPLILPVPDDVRMDN